MSKKTSYITVSLCQGWNKGIQIRYILNTRAWWHDYLRAKSLTEDGYWYAARIPYLYLLHNAYTWGLKNGRLLLSYPAFEAAVVRYEMPEGDAPRRCPYRRYRRWLRQPHHAAFKYRKQAHHRPKDNLDNPWREEKLRDHRKGSRARHKGFKYYKKERAISHRAKVRQWIAHERWDSFSQRNVSDRWEYASDTYSLYDWW